MHRSGSKCAVRGIPSVSGVSRAPCSCSAAPLEGLYCQRPIQCLASSEILIPHPLTARCGGKDTFARWRGGGGVNILEDARHCSVLYICKYTLSCSGPLHLAQQVYFSQLCQQDHAWHQVFIRCALG